PGAAGATDWGAVEREIESLRERMARMGNVNLAAVDELREVDERLSFLVGQRDDLLAAKAALEDTIRTVDAESRQRFTVTFEEIRGHFHVIFRKLFRGGKADIFLAEGQDVLEAGIEIVAAPPGKDPRSISLLSGGERTLTAVGLLFALFRARPSPVCMLDEVDAALDETNIDRFCTVLEDFLQGSQFLVVTHARRTMSYAGTLYGITMQEHGVSRALSLTLRDYDEGRQAGPAGGAARQAPAGPGPRPEVVQGAAELAQDG
ncbi:MAG: chromosome segregation protein SMC, partial [Planctomycetes bacterium]|nr:chromosome segregation protein SMC [Planctomycetota bacterium]